MSTSNVAKKRCYDAIAYERFPPAQEMRMFPDRRKIDDAIEQRIVFHRDAATEERDAKTRRALGTLPIIPRWESLAYVLENADMLRGSLTKWFLPMMRHSHRSRGKFIAFLCDAFDNDATSSVTFQEFLLVLAHFDARSVELRRAFVNMHATTSLRDAMVAVVPEVKKHPSHEWGSEEQMNDKIDEMGNLLVQALSAHPCLATYTPTVETPDADPESFIRSVVDSLRGADEIVVRRRYLTVEACESIMVRCHLQNKQSVACVRWYGGYTLFIRLQAETK